MQPQMASVLRGWTRPTQMCVVTKSASDFELLETVDGVAWFEAFLTPSPSQNTNRKNEGLRIWRRWDMYTTQDLPPDAVVQDPCGVQFRVQSKDNWQQAGVYHYDLAEQPPQPAASPALPEPQI